MDSDDPKERLSTFTMIEQEGQPQPDSMMILGQNQNESNEQTTVLMGAPMQQQNMPYWNASVPIQGVSSASKIIGVCLIIYSVIFTLLGIVDLQTNDYDNSTLSSLSYVSIAITLAFGFSGFEMTKFKKRGVQLGLLLIVASMVVSVLQLQHAEELIQDECENGDFTEEECQQLQEMDGLVQGVGTAFLFVCNGFCGLLIAIPLMLNNGGLDNSSLFKSSKN